MHVFRENGWAEIHGAPRWFLQYAGRHLSIPVKPGSKPSERLGGVWYHHGEPFGSLVHVEGTSARVGAGLATYIESLASYYRLSCEVHDKRQAPSEQYPWHSVQASWRPYQEQVHRGVCAWGSGIVDAPPRSGKTIMAARTIDTLAQPVLYVAPKVAIVRQTYEVLKRHFGGDMVACISGDAKPDESDISKPIVVSTEASAVRQSQEWFDTRRALIIDEFHHAAAETYHKISIKARHAYYRFMWTGTHFRTGEDGLAMEAVCSQVIHRIPLETLVPRYLAPPHVLFCTVPGPDLPYQDDWRAAYEEGVVNHERRNQRVSRLTAALVGKGVPTLVLTKYRDHADLLGDLIPDSAVVKGGQNQLTSRSIKEFLEGRCQVLIGTTVLGEGVDVPRAGAVVYASGGSDSVMMAQSYYRPLTAFEGKSKGWIVDFRDQHYRSLADHATKRRRSAIQLFGEARVASEP